MPYAEYDLVTGLIKATNSVLPDSSLLSSQGRGAIIVPDGVTGGTHYIDILTLNPITLPSPPNDGTN